MTDLLILFLFLTAAIAVTLLFLQGAFHILRLSHTPARRFLMLAKDFVQSKQYALALHRAVNNPVLPKGSSHFDAGAVMNPGAVVHDGRVHLFYRAVGMDGVSRIGYASSPDGLHFDERLPYPVYALASSGNARNAELRKQYDPELYAKLYASGGSWDGVEDPRATIIDGRLYLTFSAFQGWDSLRIGVVSIPEEHLARKKWTWSQPVFLSAPGDVQKNWILFPRKINGKFALLHGFRKGTRRRANVAYFTTLDAEPSEHLQSDYGYADEIDENVWDSRIRGFGAPPIETPHGWLAFYHANDVHEPHRYKLGAVLLDRDDPTKILARSREPVLEPDMPYENEGKPGVVYATGAIIKDGLLVVYYGGADNVICAAAAPAKAFIEALRTETRPKMRRMAAASMPLPA